MISPPSGRPRTAAISRVTLFPGRCPPIPGLADWPILISTASTRRRFSSVTLYWFGTYSKMYLYALSISSSRIPPSPEHIAVPTAALPLARAILISRDRCTERHVADDRSAFPAPADGPPRADDGSGPNGFVLIQWKLVELSSLDQQIIPGNGISC